MMFLLATLLIQMSLVFSTHFRDTQRRETIVDNGDYFEVCKQAPTELGLVLDASSSIRHNDFLSAITFLQNYIKTFEVSSGDDGVRVSIITYGKGIYPQDGFNLTTYSTAEEVANAIGKIPHRAGLYTDTGKAINYMHDVQLSRDVARSWAQKFSIVLTDGNSQEWRLTKTSAENARADGITVFAIGVGSGVRDEELFNIAGDQSRVIKVDKYDDLPKILVSLVSKTCIQKAKPTTTPLPKTETCGELKPSDVYFVFSPASLGPDATAWTTSFISNTISTENLDVGFRYGVVSGSCPIDEGFDLDTYTTVDGYKERLQSYDAYGVSQLIERLVNDGYSEERGGRPSASKVAVIVASGDGKEDSELEYYVKQLTDAGVKVFVADPSGNGVSVTGAETLTGRSSRLQSETLVSYLCP